MMTKYNSFLLQATIVMDNNKYTRHELEMIYNFIRLVDDEILEEYKITNTLPNFENDLMLFIEILDELIKVFERTEEYDKCLILKTKKEKSIFILKRTGNE